MSLEESQERLKAGRNDPCPCGSGKKYKKGHRGEDEQTVSADLKRLEQEAKDAQEAKDKEEKKNLMQQLKEEKKEDGLIKVKKIKLESYFFNAFRNLIRITFANPEHLNKKQHGKNHLINQIKIICTI